MNLYFRLIAFVVTAFGLTIGAVLAAGVQFEELGAPGSAQTAYGVVTSFSVTLPSAPATTLATDMSSQAPAGGPASSSAVGVLKGLAWPGGSTDFIQMKFVISTANAMKVRRLLQTAPKTQSITGHVIVYNFDPAAQRWYTAFDCGIGGKATIQLAGTLPPWTIQVAVPASGLCKVAYSASQTIVKPVATP
jgi:hypothetical protein